MNTLPLDEDSCYEACAGREHAWDGHFVLAVTSTGIYCRPSCPARLPRRENCRFFVSAAAAVAAGFRACRRCRPDRLPGEMGWSRREDLVGRVVQAIRDGVVDDLGVAGLSERLGVGVRQLNRIFREEVGATIHQVNRTRRAHTARMLMDHTDWRLGEIAFAAGFGSIRQFNDVMRAEFGTSPRGLRRHPEPETARGGSGRIRLTVRLPAPGVQAATAMRAALAAHAVPGVEKFESGMLTRLVDTPAGAALARTDVMGRVELDLPALGALAPTLGAVRRWLALDADTATADALLGCDPQLAQLVAERPGLRVPGVVDGAEFAFFTVLGQQISLAAARTVQERFITSHGRPAPGLGEQWRLPPEPAAVAEVGENGLRESLRLTRSKAATLHALAAELAGGLRVDPWTDRGETRSRLLGIRGIGAWTTEFIAMRGLGDPDACPSGDLVLQRALGLATSREVLARAEAWRPWRSRAVMHLWTKESYL